MERYLPPFGFTGHYSLATRHSPRIGRTIPLGCLARYHAQSKLNLAGEFRPLSSLYPHGVESCPTMTMSSSVTIGSRPDCDLVVNVPSVSGHHCRLTRDETGFVLEDLNSTNGTFVNGERIRGAVRVRLTATDTIHLGSHALSAERLLSLIDREPAPAISFRGAEMVIGRIPGCDHVIDLPMISSRHARLFREGDRILIEDLRSSNGTFVNGTRVEGPVVLNSGDEVGLGSHRVTLTADSWTQADVVQPARPSEPLPGTPQAAVPSLTESSTTSSTSSPATELAGILSRPWPLVALLAQAPLTAFLIVGLVGTDSPAPILFWLGLAAIWFGLADAVLGNLLDPTRLRAGLSPDGAPALALRLLMLAALCASSVPARLGDRREHGGSEGSWPCGSRPAGPGLGRWSGPGPVDRRPVPATDFGVGNPAGDRSSHVALRRPVASPTSNARARGGRGGFGLPAVTLGV